MADEAYNSAAVTPSDTLPLPAISRRLGWFNTGTQTLKYQPAGPPGALPVTVEMPSGIYDIRATQVFSTGTTVTSIVVFWD
jgi:hypothetical protein